MEGKSTHGLRLDQLANLLHIAAADTETSEAEAPEQSRDQAVPSRPDQSSKPAADGAGTPPGSIS